MKFSAKYIRYVSLIAAVILALPFRLGVWKGLFLWMSPLIFLNSLLSVKSLVLLNGLGLCALAAVLMRPRWFCHFACPTGVLCDAASQSATRRTGLSCIPSFHKMLCIVSLVLAVFGVPLLMILDPINLFYAFFDCLQSLPVRIALLKISGLLAIVLLNVWIPHLWCQKVCPLGGLQDLLTETRMAFRKSANDTYRRFIPGRRSMMAGIVGAITGLVLRKDAQSQAAPVLRPPGAMDETRFKVVCSRCGNCVKTCPTGIIRSSLDPGDWLGALTPQIRFYDSYCLFDCTRCGDVCPSGAIAKFSLDDKKHLVIGIARIRLDDCLLLHNRECDRCKTVCEYEAIRIKTPEDDFYSYPDVIEDRCTGCGACQIICPVEVIEIKAVLNGSSVLKQFKFV